MKTKTDAKIDELGGGEMTRGEFETDCVANGWMFLSRSSEPGYTDEYENPLYQARWNGWQAAMKTKIDQKIEALSARCAALEDAMDVVATQLNEQIQLNAVLRALLEELTEKRK